MAASVVKVPLPDDPDQSMACQPPPQPQQQPQYPGQQYQGPQHPGQPYPGQQPQTVYIQKLPSHPHRYDNYNGKLSVIFGVSLIVMTTIAIILNGAGFAIQINRVYDWIGNFMYIMFPSVWCGVFIYISAAFAIAAGKCRSRGLIIAHMVLAIIGTTFAFVYTGLTAGALAYDGVNGGHSAKDKQSLGISVVWMLLSIVITIMITWCSVLCCQVMCCGQTTQPVGIAMVVAGPSGQPEGSQGPPGGAVAYHVNPAGASSPPPPYEEM